MIHKAKDLSPEQKVAIESLLGRSVLDEEAISVRTVEPPALTDQQKHELADQFRKYYAAVDARRQPGSAEEAEGILTEAIRSSRPGYRPHQ
ncbi:MAG: hypothetical protein WAO35_22665 [Terriglobia bacterium]